MNFSFYLPTFWLFLYLILHKFCSVLTCAILWNRFIICTERHFYSRNSAIFQVLELYLLHNQHQQGKFLIFFSYFLIAICISYYTSFVVFWYVIFCYRFNIYKTITYQAWGWQNHIKTSIREFPIWICYLVVILERLGLRFISLFVVGYIHYDRKW